MSKKLMLLVFLLVVLSLSAFAAEGEVIKAEKAHLLFLSSIIVGTVCLTVAAVVGAITQSKALRVAVDNIGRNPAAADSIRTALIIGLALIESLVIYVLLVNLILFFVLWGKYSY